MAPRFLRRTIEWLQPSSSITPPGVPDSTSYDTGFLPTIICEMIIDLIAGKNFLGFWGTDALETLRACSLTCRGWRPRSQHHLFRFISVHCSTKGQKSAKHLVALLSKHPALQSHVETLIVRDFTQRNPMFNKLSMGLANVLPHIRTLRLSGLIVYSASGKALQKSLRQFGAVKTLDLYGVAFYSLRHLQRVVCSFDELNILHASIFWRDSTDNVTHFERPMTTARLKRLRISTNARGATDPRSVHFIEWLTLSGIVSSTEFIILNQMMILDDAMFAAVETMVESSKASLQTLSISFGPDVDFTRLSTALTRCKQLQVLVIIIPDDAPAFSRLVEVLEMTMIFKCNILFLQLKRYSPAFAEPASPAEWERLDLSLQKPQWLSVKRIYVAQLSVIDSDDRHFCWGDSYPEVPLNTHEIHVQLRTKLRRTHNRGVLWHYYGDRDIYSHHYSSKVLSSSEEA